jgi:hypothetical protein
MRVPEPLIHLSSPLMKTSLSITSSIHRQEEADNTGGRRRLVNRLVKETIGWTSTNHVQSFLRNFFPESCPLLAFLSNGARSSCKRAPAFQRCFCCAPGKPAIHLQRLMLVTLFHPERAPPLLLTFLQQLRDVPPDYPDEEAFGKPVNKQGMRSRLPI